MWAFLALLVVLMMGRPGPYGWDAVWALWRDAPAPPVLLALAPANARFEVPSRAMPLCVGPIRRNCVVDGDTFWLDGEKIRIETIDAPEVAGRCTREIELAARATRRLSVLLSGRQLSVTRNGTDRFGRTLASVRTEHGEVGSKLVGDGLAQRWLGRKAEWCNV